MRQTVRVITLAVLFAAGAAFADCPPCGPMTCLNDPGFPKARDAKKAKLKAAGFPTEFLALVDKDGPCKLCLENAPDGFSILVVKANDATESQPWTAEREKYAKEDIKSGAAKAYFILYARKRCACCNEKPAEQQPDWDAKLSMSKSLSIPHTSRP